MTAGFVFLHGNISLAKKYKPGGHRRHRPPLQQMLADWTTLALALT